MPTANEYAAAPIISTRGLNKWDAQQGVGALLVQPGVRLEVARVWRNGEVFAHLQLWTQNDPQTPGGWQPAGPEFALPVTCITDVVRLLTAGAASAADHQCIAPEEAHAVHALQ